MAYKAMELAYCTNVHAGESVSEINVNLDRFVGPVREVSKSEHMSAGLWISNKAALALDDHATRKIFKRKLVDNKLSLHSLNGFPFADFHQHIIKEGVYLPDWSEQSRLDYTVLLATLLADCLTKDASGGTLSTLPLGFKKNWTKDKHQIALQNLLKLVQTLNVLEITTGKRIQVCLEMEPACVLEKTEHLLDLFNEDLNSLAIESGIDTDLVYTYLGICYDVCHQAVMFEDISASLTHINDAGITIGKIQLSSALRFHSASLADIKKQLTPFDEPRYLHQTSIKSVGGEVVFYTDLSEALQHSQIDSDQEWRVHYHVPLQLGKINAEGLATTRNACDDVFAFLAVNPHLKPHLEVETYTWNVLPETIRPADDASLVKGIDAELCYVKDKLEHYKLMDHVA